MRQMIPVYIAVGVVLVVLGPIGFLMAKRRGGAQSRRDFLIWYALVWPFAAAGLTAMSSPKLHWLYSVDFAIAASPYVVQIVRWQRKRATARAR